MSWIYNCIGSDYQNKTQDAINPINVISHQNIYTKSMRMYWAVYYSKELLKTIEKWREEILKRHYTMK